MSFGNKAWLPKVHLRGCRRTKTAIECSRHARYTTVGPSPTVDGYYVHPAPHLGTAHTHPPSAISCMPACPCLCSGLLTPTQQPSPSLSVRSTSLFPFLFFSWLSLCLLCRSLQFVSLPPISNQPTLPLSFCAYPISLHLPPIHLSSYPSIPTLTRDLHHIVNPPSHPFNLSFLSRFSFLLLALLTFTSHSHIDGPSKAKLSSLSKSTSKSIQLTSWFNWFFVPGDCDSSAIPNSQITSFWASTTTDPRRPWSCGHLIRLEVVCNPLLCCVLFSRTCVDFVQDKLPSGRLDCRHTTPFSAKPQTT